MTVETRSEKSSQSRQIYFAALRDEKSRQVCLISDKEAQ